MQKSKLKNGDKVVHRNGRIFIKIGKFFCNDGGMNVVSIFEDDLTYKDDDEWDIVEVWRPHTKYSVLRPMDCFDLHEQIFER